MKKLYRIIIPGIILFSAHIVTAQAVLNADGPGNTYELINSVLAPGHDVVENPECVHPAFGRHIAEIFDTELNRFVFEFYSHVTPDNDRCINFDRQRVEIKTYDQSPDSLIGTVGETITYKWRFKIPAGFQPSSSFTHIHQVKPVNGDDGNPIFTLTPRKGTPNKLELIYVESETSGTNKLRIVNLSLFENVWVEVIEQIVVGPNGSYFISINRVSDGASILSYSNSNIATIRPDNSFIRPKWGIYRSLNTPADLRDESIRFSDISIDEGIAVLPLQLLSFKGKANSRSVELSWKAVSEEAGGKFVMERSVDGILFTPLIAMQAGASGERTYQFTDNNPASGNNYYRIKLTDSDGRFTYSDRVLVKFSRETNAAMMIYPNPVQSKIIIEVAGQDGYHQCSIRNSEGRTMFSGRGTIPQLTVSINRQLTGFSPGIYFMNLFNGKDFYRSKFLKE